jgi:hypothetical protein
MLREASDPQAKQSEVRIQRKHINLLQLITYERNRQGSKKDSVDRFTDHCRSLAVTFVGSSLAENDLPLSSIHVILARM